MKIEFIGDPSAEPEAYVAACRRLLTRGDPSLTARVDVLKRRDNGFLDWLIWIGDATGTHKITIGMIQREKGAEFEFHS